MTHSTSSISAVASRTGVDQQPRRRRVRLSGRGIAQKARENSLNILILLFFVSLFFPAIIQLGPIRLSFYRILLISLFIPLMIGWMTGRAGRVILADKLIFLFCSWVAISFFFNHGLTNGIEPAGIWFIETFGAYLFARRFIRSPEQFFKLIKLLVGISLAMIPIALYEALTNKQLINNLISSVFAVYGDNDMRPRWGLERVQGPFEHPILFGVFFSAIFSLAAMARRTDRGRLPQFVGAGAAAANTFFSLSVGAFISLILQAILMIWNRVMRFTGRWKILIFGVLFAYLIVDIISNRSPIQVFISYATFNAGNAWNRIHIWEYGTAEVARHPIFGIGLHEWTRAPWMSTSMDNFWLLIAVRHGLPGLLLLACAIGLILRGVARANLHSPGFTGLQNAFLFSFIGLALAICTVHLWNATYVFLLFLAGAGVWMFNEPEHQAAGGQARETGRSARRGAERRALAGRARAQADRSETITG